MCNKLRVFAVLGVMFFLNGCQKPRPIINEYEDFVGVWNYQGEEKIISPDSSPEFSYSVNENEFVEKGLRLTISSDGRLLIESDEDAIYQGKIMNVGIAAGKTLYMPGVVLRSTCFHVDPPIGQLRRICAVIHDGDLRTRQIPFEVIAFPDWISNQFFQKK